MNNLTFGMIKPDAIEKNYTGKIIDFILQNGFKILALKQIQMTTRQAELFYYVHHNRQFYRELVEYITRGPVIAMVIEKENAVQSFREILGATDPAEAANGTIRKLYGESKAINAIHGSDSDENAQIEISFMFNQLEIING
ncbi:MAG TPA: nucleoside-diphosphate kinase [Candidatus Kapabacteria bacterium]|jgi:nucleoside-diphosphate kinase|nr:nucleoside-diphosphate kinase [Candidatus Kapabacteria bacterium]HOV91913.1 nucleoside-diphosphate kinase [Candidatus Kapabacteria bacterium]